MYSLISLTYNSLFLIILLCAITIVFQSLNVVHSFLVYRRQKLYYQTFTDVFILVELFFYIYSLAKLIYNLSDGYCIIIEYHFIRYLIFGLICLSTLILIYRQKQAFELIVIINSLLTIPCMEKLLDDKFPIIFIVSLFVWLFRAMLNLANLLKQESHNLSALSIKQALDTLDFGLLFCRADGKNDGQIILSNDKMQDLMYSLVGHQIFNGKYFYECLKEAKVLIGSTKQPIENQIVYTLPDNTVWSFNLEVIFISGVKCVLLIASNNTKLQNANLELYYQHQQLERQNKVLRSMLNDIEDLCRNEEILAAKARVHDLLGQRISLILRSVREHQKPDHKLLASIETGLLEELKNGNPECDFSLAKLVSNFKDLGIDVTIEGQLPNNDKIKLVFYKIIAEAMTNSVRHGFASEISIIIENDKDMWALLIQDNGKSKTDKISEGGGLSNMRKLVNELNGEFQYETKPHFTILVKVRERGHYD